MSKIKLPIKNLEPLDVKKIKNAILHSNSWDSIEEVCNFCNEVMKLNDDFESQAKYTIEEIIEKIQK